MWKADAKLKFTNFDFIAETTSSAHSEEDKKT